MVLGIVASVVSLIKSTTGSVNVFGDVDVVRADCIMPLASLGVCVVVCLHSLTSVRCR